MPFVEDKDSSFLDNRNGKNSICHGLVAHCYGFDAIREYVHFSDNSIIHIGGDQLVRRCQVLDCHANNANSRNGVQDGR